jgi:hypothetical protein
MPLTLADHFALIEAELADLDARPLSARQTKLVMVLLDKFADRIFLARREQHPDRVVEAGGRTIEDGIAWRDCLRQSCPALGALFDVCAIPPTATLETRAVEVPIADYPRLSTADFMVSLYNGLTVQRVLLVFPDGETRLARDVIAAAMEWWRASGLIGHQPHPD